MLTLYPPILLFLIGLLLPCFLPLDSLSLPSLQQSKAKALAGEKSIDFIQYRRALSKTSSSGSSYEQPPGTTNRTNSRDETLRELSEQRDDEVTEVMRRLSVVEEEKEKLRKEKEKLERKLKEAETVAEQAGTAATEVNTQNLIQSFCEYFFV